MARWKSAKGDAKAEEQQDAVDKSLLKLQRGNSLQGCTKQGWQWLQHRARCHPYFV